MSEGRGRPRGGPARGKVATSSYGAMAPGRSKGAPAPWRRGDQALLPKWMQIAGLLCRHVLSHYCTIYILVTRPCDPSA